MKKLFFSLLLTAMAAQAAVAQEYYVKQVTFPEGATLEEKIDMASRLVPSAKQLAWQELGLTAFLHFGVNTFTNREWGDGSEDPAIFNPDALDTDQWVETLKNAGFKLVLLTAKHHDGFCLWPTATSEHSVASSPWLDGKGDVVAMLRKSCDKYGMKLGLYLSPWDRNAECYGDSPRYNDMFVAQLTELLTQYGEIDEVWFDGACGEGPNGKKQEYDWQRFKETIEALQPNAVVAIMGDDVRWVGNEKGLGRETEWSATAFVPGILPESEETNKAMNLFSKAPDLGSRDIVAKAQKLYWWPSEVDVSIRPGWFYHENEAPHSLRKLANIYINSVGRNSVLLLNIPPDTHGRIADADVQRLAELNQWVKDNLEQSLLAQPGVAATEQNVNGPVNAIALREDLTKGQRVESFAVEAKVGNEWQPVAEGTTIGYNRILVFDTVDAEAVRLVVKEARGDHNAYIYGAYLIEMPPYEAPALPAGYTYADRKRWKSPDAAKAAYDGDANNIWTSAPDQKSLTIDMGKCKKTAGFAYTPRQDDKREGMIFKYRLWVSKNGKKWEPMELNNEFSNIVNNPITQNVYFNSHVDARYIKLESLETADGSNNITVGDFNVILPNK